MSLENRVAIITGAARGIGAGIVEHFHAAGAAVVGVDIGKQREDGPNFHSIHGDVSNEEDMRRVAAETVAHFGRLDIVVNNAGMEVMSPPEHLSEADWDRQIDVNLKGAFLLSKHAVPHMQKVGGGAIVNISSVHAYVAYPHFAGYDASKAGLLGLTRSLALDLGKYNIRVNVICPGYINTAMMEQWLSSLPDRDAALRQVYSAHPLGRIGAPADIAQAALFLCSDSAAFITGASLVVDGGMTLAGH